MNSNSKTFHTEHDFSDNKMLFRISGEIDHHSAKSIREEIDELIFSERPKELYLDFSNVEFMDSSGLGLIMGRYKLMRVYRGKTYILNPSHRILRIIELAGMNRIIDIVCTEENNDSTEERKNKNESVE